MKLIYNDTTTEIKQDEQVFNMIFETVNELITKEKLVFSHLIIDGVEVFEAHEEYIQTRLVELEEIQIVMRTMEEIISDILESIYSYLERAVPAVDDLVNGSFTGFTDATWSGIAQLTEGMEWMLQFIEGLRESEVKPVNWEAIDKSFTHCEAQFKSLLEAIEANDEMLMTDILSFDIGPAYEDVKLHVKKSIDQTSMN